MTNPDRSFLSIAQLNVYYGDIRSLTDISFDLNPGDRLSIVGANGAGKSSLLNTIAGLVAPRTGTIIYRGQDITKQPTHQRSCSGLILVPEGRRIFTRLSVEENLLCGHFPYPLKEFPQAAEKIYNLFPRLYERKKQKAGFLSGGEQQMLAIGRAMASRPTVLMLDEPSMGLAPKITRLIFQAIEVLSEKGITVILVEQNMRLAARYAEKTIFLKHGQIEQ